MLRDTRCFFPANKLCRALENHVIVRSYLLNGDVLEEDGTTFRDRLRWRMSTNSFRVHKDESTFAAETNAIMMMASRACNGTAFPLQPMALSTKEWFGFGKTDDVVAFEVSRLSGGQNLTRKTSKSESNGGALMFTVYPPDCVTLKSLLRLPTTSAIGHEHRFTKRMIDPLMKMMHTLNALSEVQGVHLNISLESIYYSFETKQFYLGHWEHLQSIQKAKELLAVEDAGLQGNNRTDAVRSHEIGRSARYSKACELGELDARPPKLEASSVNPYAQCLAIHKTKSDDVIRDRLFNCVDTIVGDSAILEEFKYEDDAAWMRTGHLLQDNDYGRYADTLAAYLLPVLDLYSFMMVIRKVQKSQGIKLDQKTLDIMARTLSPHHSDPFLSFGDAYESYVDYEQYVKEYSTLRDKPYKKYVIPRIKQLHT